LAAARSLPTLPRATDIKTQRSAAAKAITVHEGRLRQLCLLKKTTLHRATVESAVLSIVRHEAETARAGCTGQ